MHASLDMMSDRNVDAASRRRLCDARRNALPEVIRTAFECTKKTPMHELLRALGVEAEASSIVERVYESERGPPVVAVWLDRIERDADGSLAYWIDAFDGRPQARFADGSARLEAVLKKHVGEEVYVVLLERGPGGDGVAGAPDIVRWTLASAGRSWFVLRRPMVRREA